MNLRWSAAVAALLLSVHSVPAGQAYSPERVSEVNPSADVAVDAPYSSVGFVKSFVGKAEYSGSGAVAQDPKLLYTCAHLFYEKGRWAQLVGFQRALNSETGVDDSQTVFARGYYYFSGYTGSKKRGYDFDLDFAVAYAREGETFGPVALELNEGTTDDANGWENLTSTSTSKMILGYPAYLDADYYTQGYEFMHQTGPFQSAGPSGESFYQELGAYHGIDYVTTGPGNSGGPVLVLKEGTWRLAGILVSGSRFSAGIYAIDSYAEEVGDAALADALADVTEVGGASHSANARITKPVVLADGGTKYSSVAIRFAKLPAFATGVWLDLNVSAAKRGDLDVYVRSPAGRVYVVAVADESVSGADLNLSGFDVTSAFRLADPNGKWGVFVRDSEANSLRAQVNAAALHVTSL